ncbi:hypothetical protein V2J09_002387 [Rumex salicifolius]
MATDEVAAPAAAASGTALIKSLGACSSSTRSKTLKALISWLLLQHQPQPPLSDDELKKLWKGLFYCVWHCDKSINQANLINRLSSLLLSLSPPLSVLYFSHFLLALRREWAGIDRLRLDKFYLMIRVFIAKLFELLNKKKWRLDVVEEYWGALEDRLFVSLKDKSLGDGVTYHVVSVFCEEIKPFLPLRLEVLNVLFRPFVSVLGRTDNRVLSGKLKSDMFGYLVKSGRGLLEVKKSGNEVDSKDERVLYGTIALAMEFSLRFYELGSSPDCVQGNRKLLFSLHEEFLKLEKEMKAAGIDVKLPEVVGDEVDDDKIPQLIPISNDVNGGGKVETSDKPKKTKKKKDKGESKDKENKKKRKKNSTENGISGSHENGNADMLIDTTNEPDSPQFDDATLSNLQKQFEMIAAESGLDQGVYSSLDSPSLQGNGEVSKKRKRAKKKANGKISVDISHSGEQDAEDENNATTAEKSGKKVKFSMRHNLVWNPSNPLPPQSVRIPPSVTPRGSALKQGVPPGPVRENSSYTKKAKKASHGKKKVAKSKSPAIKRIKKLKSISP